VGEVQELGEVKPGFGFLFGYTEGKEELSFEAWGLDDFGGF
jgi:hypothetical protein